MGHRWSSDLKEIGQLLLVFLVLKHARRGNLRWEVWAAWEAHRRLGGGGGGLARVGGAAAGRGRCRGASRSRSSSAVHRPERLFPAVFSPRWSSSPIACQWFWSWEKVGLEPERVGDFSLMETEVGRGWGWLQPCPIPCSDYERNSLSSSSKREREQRWSTLMD
jgi:hypothetical protein